MSLIGFGKPVCRCRGCGCDDNHACMTGDGPCRWVLLDLDAPTGVCSACAELLGWDQRFFARLYDDADEEAA
jgi:hypothetical protein